MEMGQKIIGVVVGIMVAGWALAQIVASILINKGIKRKEKKKK